LENIKDLVDQKVNSGQWTKPALATVIDPEDYGFIRDLKQRGKTTSQVAEILHVTEECLRAELRKLNLD
jgi:hypothetical protein